MKTNRRDFLKVSAAGAAAVGGLSIARGAHAAGTGDIKIGMIGCGGRCSGAAGAALALGKDVKLAGMATIHIGLSLYAFVGLILFSAAASAAFEPHLLWHKLGYPREAAHAGH
mgnify:CR=1 FL=1